MPDLDEPEVGEPDLVQRYLTDPDLEDPARAVGRRMKRIHDTLDLIVADADVLYPATQARLLQMAWREVGPMFGPEIERLRDVPHQEWEAAGLTDVQLAFKLSMVDWALREVHHNVKPYVKRARRFGFLGKRWGRSKVAGVIAGGLGAADKFIDSVPGIGHPIKELKGLVETGAEIVSATS
jgi:hypothetical protein